jgi:hypothetical protein
MWVEEEIRFFTLWHFYGGNCAMAWWLEVVDGTFRRRPKTFGGFCVLFLVPGEIQDMIPT